MLTAEYLREVLHYTPETGVFTRRRGGGGMHCGDIAGWIAKRRSGQHLEISVNNRKYKAHRLAWLYIHGAWPNGGVDHIDRNPLNNAISNLREATQTQNMANVAAAGCTFDAAHDRFRAQIRSGGKNIYLGLFDTAEAASAVYQEAAKRIRGKFAPY
jgi:hypothetical protein